MAVVNPHNFPAKIWRLVNDPHVCSLQWDSRGDGIIIDQQLFESELLAPSREINVADDLFRTTSFSSFIRQLNLYGFRKLVYGSGASYQPARNLEAGNRTLHYFSNSFFRRGHPELLVNLKRLTNINKAKMAAGHKVPTRPPNRYQRLLPNPLEKQRRAETQGLVPLEQIHRYSNPDNISLYPYAGPVAQSYTASSMNGFGDFPVSAMMWPSSLGPHQGHLSVPSSFPEKPVFFPAMQQFPAVAYTLQSTATSLHVQQSHSFMTEAVHKYGSIPTMQYPNVYHPAAAFQYYPPPYMEHLSNFSNPAISSYQPYNYYQTPPTQTPFSMEFFHPNMPYTKYNDFQRGHVNFDTTVQVINDPRASSQLEMPKPDVQENNKEPILSSNCGHVQETLDQSQTYQLKYLLPENMDTCAVGSHQATPFLQIQASDGAYPSNSNVEITLIVDNL